jgi:hydrogenase maturation protein HypF
MSIRGAVQGVGFRPFVFRLAREMGLAGWVNNSSAGVVVEAEGPEPALRQFVSRVEAEKPAIAIIQSLEAVYLDPTGFQTFEIRASTPGEKSTLVMPDLATCPACLADIFDPHNRRHRYPFTNCTNCGPRFSIIASLPYDRCATTMRDFAMCEACQREYGDPLDRRFHAQPNACPACGPRLALWTPDRSEVATGDAALLATAEAIRSGKIVAVKGLGGFHLMVDARNAHSVRELRHRKHREEKPFALMVASFEQALQLCHASLVEQRLLQSPESPIVLLRQRPGHGLAAAIAPGNPTLGILLPSTPLHHLLLAELRFPVVATSGNVSDEPICTDEQEALARLAAIADLFLVHNRPILRHVDDSIVREMCGRELVLRRARGFAPLPVHLDTDLPAVIAVGAHQKNTIAAAVGSDVFISQHIGDLETLASFHAFEHVLEAFRSLYALRPEKVACDMHPDYLSSQHARQHARQAGLAVVEVQHHVAHALACMAENRLAGPVLAITWDGSGMGPDGTVWGGEFLHVTPDGYRRVAHFRPFLLPGNAKAVREPRRVALALLYEIFGEAAFAMDAAPVRAFSDEERTGLASVLLRRLNAPVTTSAGRLFDAFASLLDLRHVASFEGQAAMELEFALADQKEDNSYPYAIHDQGPCLVLDWEPAVHAVLARPSPGQAAASARFHNTLVEMAVDVASRVRESRVVLSGGCFQNRYLTERMVARLRSAGLRPYWHQRVPPNDGGISLGQVVAAARFTGLRKE